MWVRLIVAASAMVGASACIIGPKQDDPATPDRMFDDASVPHDSSVGSVLDASDDSGPALQQDAAGDLGTGGDSSLPPATEAGCVTDAADADADASEAGCAPDGGSDAVAAD